RPRAPATLFPYTTLFRSLPQVVNTNLEAPGFDGLTQQRVAQRVKVLGEDRQDIESHASSSSPSGGVTTRASLSRSTMGTIASLNGMRIVEPAVGRSASASTATSRVAPAGP